MQADAKDIRIQPRRKTFDAIVIGSGITGGWAAKELCEKGLKVLMLERGKPLEHPNYPTASLHPWELENRGRLTLEDKQRSPIQSRHFSYRGDNKHFYINDLENPYTEVKRFDWIRGDIVGGRSVLWGRACYRFSELDFEANRRDGFGVDWPIRYGDLAPWYDYVERFIGVSGNADGIPHLPDGIYQPPMAMNCVEQDFKKIIEQKYRDRRVIMGRAANLTAPVKGRGLCQYRDMCHRGCPFGAYFSTNSSTLPAAFATGRLTLRTNALVNRIIYDERKERATGVEIIDTETNKVTEYYAKIIFVNAATLGTTFILLNSTSARFPNGLGNGSDRLGRYLMDHHKGAGATADIEGYEDKYYLGRRANQVVIPRFRNVAEQHPDYLRAFAHYGQASRKNMAAQEPLEAFGASFKAAIAEPGPWSMYFAAYGECLPYADNRATLDTDKKDKWGRNTLKIDAEFKENEKNMQKDMAATAAEMLDAAGYKNVRPFQNMSFPGNSNHEMGTACMGRDPKTSVLNAFNQMHEVKNVFVTDGACMSSGSNVNPSLTYMALTARACDYAVKELKKRNI